MSEKKLEILFSRLAAADWPGQLEKHLLHAGAAIEKDHLQSALQHLQQFQKEVHRRLGRADPALAEELIAAAQAIIDQATEQLEPKKSKKPQKNSKPLSSKR